MVSPQKIKYNGVFSDTGLGDLDIILDVAFDSDDGAMSSYLNRSAVAVESHDGRYRNTTRYKYDELFSPQFTIVKKDFSDFTQEQIRRVLKYLTSTDKPSLLEVYYDGDSNIVDWACIGGWTSIETYKLANSRTVGIVAQFEAITPYAMSDIYSYTISKEDNHTKTIVINTDDNKPVCPRIIINHGYGTPTTPHSVVNIPSTVQFNNILEMTDYVENTVYYNGTTYYWKTSEAVFRSDSVAPAYEAWAIVEATRAYTEEDSFEANTFYHYNGVYYWLDPYSFHSSQNDPSLDTTSVKITNTHYDVWGKPTVLPSVIVKNNSLTEAVTLDGANKIVSSSNTRRIYGDDFNWQWLELYDGTNEITVLGNCEVTLEYRTVIKCGEY